MENEHGLTAFQQDMAALETARKIIYRLEQQSPWWTQQSKLTRQWILAPRRVNPRLGRRQ